MQHWYLTYTLQQEQDSVTMLILSVWEHSTTGAKVREMLVDAFFTNEFVPGCSSQPKVDAFREYDQNR